MKPLEEKVKNVHGQLFSLLSQFKYLCVTKLNTLPNQIKKIIIGENKIPYLVSGVIQKITDDDLKYATIIDDRAFYDCKNLANVTIPNGITSIGEKSFYNCIKLDNIVIPNSVVQIGDGSFGYCQNLTNVTLSENITRISSGAFENCINLSKIIVPNSVTQIADNAFKNCSNLIELAMPASAKIYNRRTTFADCTNLKKVILTKGSGTMRNCGTSTSTTSDTHYTYTPWYIGQSDTIIIEDGVTNIGDCAFYHCKSLTNITIPNSVTSIGDWAFRQCSGLEHVSIPNGVTYIGRYAFEHCGLTRVDIPSSVTIMKWATFSGCAGLMDVYFYATTPPTLERNLDYDTFPSTTTIHVPVGSGDAYKSATNWSLFASQIVEDIVIE